VVSSRHPRNPEIGASLSLGIEYAILIDLGRLLSWGVNRLIGYPWWIHGGWREETWVRCFSTKVIGRHTTTHWRHGKAFGGVINRRYNIVDCWSSCQRIFESFAITVVS
jgi:hypothetical protein